MDDRPALEVRLVDDEARAALEIMAAARRDTVVDRVLWEELFGTEGYRRLEAREASLGREFEKDTFQAFLLADSTLDRASELARTLDDWSGVDLSTAAERALAYLPAGSRIRARLYPVIKPRTNSFVFELGTDSAAIFLYLDPTVGAARLENTLAHELHHVGYAAACADRPDAGLSPGAREAERWMGAFGEGIAMLAAAGSARVHPHVASDPDERARWDRDVANVSNDLPRVERFFLDLVHGRLTEPADIQDRAMSFFGEQGPWYTVGWVMAATIESVLGRERLVAVVCDPPALLRVYNEAAGELDRGSAEPLPLWSEALLAHFP